MNKPTFEKPLVEIVMFEDLDIITTSNPINDEWTDDYIVPMD